MGRQCQVLISPCLSLLLLQCLWFIRGMMAGQGRGQVWRFGRGRKRGRAGDWFVIAVLALWFTVSACSPFNSGHRKSNTIHISGCHVRFISSYVSWVFLYRKRKGKAAVVMPCLKRWGQKREVGGGVGWGGGECYLRPLGGTGGTKNPLYLSLLCFVKRSGCRSLLLSAVPLRHRFGLYNYAFINTSSAMCFVPSRWLTEGYRGH